MKPRIGLTVSPAVHDDGPIIRLGRWYVEAVVRAGGLPLVLPILDPEDAADVLANVDGLLLTGGGDVAPGRYGEDPVPEVYGVDQDRDEWELALVVAATAARKPVLGVCRGEQLINVAFGGTLVQHLVAGQTGESHRQPGREGEPVHPVGLDPNSTLAKIVGPQPLGVNTMHHQAVARVGAGLRAVAWAPDGVIEAIESADDRPIVAVQWHPEWLIDHPRHGRLFGWLTRMAMSSTAPATVALVDDVA